MKILLCAIVALPLMLFGVESASSSNQKAIKKAIPSHQMIKAKIKAWNHR